VERLIVIFRMPRIRMLKAGKMCQKTKKNRKILGKPRRVFEKKKNQCNRKRDAYVFYGIMWVYIFIYRNLMKRIYIQIYTFLYIHFEQRCMCLGILLSVSIRLTFLLKCFIVNT